MSDFKIDDSCLGIEAINRPCPECGEANETHFVSLDLGSEKTAVFLGCYDCCVERAEELREMLPHAKVEP